MIQITINRNRSGLIQSFTITGHALFDEHGKDIVCAGASAVSFGAINAVHELTGIIPSIEQGEDGFLSVAVPEDIPDTVQEKIQLILEAMVISLQTIEEQYGEHIKITFKK
ncbi:ribosomal-processing cysteine protease Prp [Niallia endozanthoxylica]|uniref:Ribosomal processing cysteine protease Prp n=1 Tax=Niallia endozanthoxylica TaxID=2036016 RepID=A0A5J5HR65_9BACI|nr:ribosomal-processing cysteine protease Prp [Niallia endozanthoxylica]KAA9023119.1 ribosomal-processing cysteine protease Prp [Niallia endozanthoxylica]